MRRSLGVPGTSGLVVDTGGGVEAAGDALVDVETVDASASVDGGGVADAAPEEDDAGVAAGGLLHAAETTTSTTSTERAGVIGRS